MKARTALAVLFVALAALGGSLFFLKKTDGQAGLTGIYDQPSIGCVSIDCTVLADTTSN